MNCPKDPYGVDSARVTVIISFELASTFHAFNSKCFSKRQKNCKHKKRDLTLFKYTKIKFEETTKKSHNDSDNYLSFRYVTMYAKCQAKIF